MRVKNAKIKITIPIPIDEPDYNGTVYTEKAIENAVNNLHKNLPVIYRDNESVIDGVVIGTTTGNSHIVSWDFENQICNLTIDGIIFYGGTEERVNEIRDGKVTDFEIVSIGISKWRGKNYELLYKT